jgi:hypothetical protein
MIISIAVETWTHVRRKNGARSLSDRKSKASCGRFTRNYTWQQIHDLA